MMQNTQNFPTDIIESLLTEHHDFKVDVYESNGAYQVIAELPGYSKDDVTIQFEDKTLTIRVTQTSTTTENQDQYLIRERNSNEQSRQFIFKNVDKENIKATMEDGILSVELPINHTKTQINID
ncbi:MULTISPECIES: Hsp20 family protein [Staphylococcus]|jgi:HSP20 family protein|uniref:Heat-shock protein n=1 Tax=Staphylococcus nepalensis TaxID=214473 RepID=A0A2T4SB77_9STAP|nr:MULTISPECIES: Hsp20 family protein [Staphylococcus]VDG66283.1 18 kDa heat shock protein Hsp [Lacrimispora indolis]MBO1205668.1 Hsp20 family protein [Staphylococcus nepalensis]MBO1212694.1 Hsp20 family protein [Staphylococcus nepalensis]MBO1215861.1 Hsp20 family protein [Staphylococcus nepalensis]MBO1221130.1 Hsp20 family protein [Staphylococcus nepalensis]